MAQMLIDVGNRAIFAPSVVAQSPSSGLAIGTLVDLKDADSYCNLFVVVSPSTPTGSVSGVISVQVQCADGVSGALFSGGGLPLSGSWTDPTSGLASVNPPTFPTYFVSGGIVNFNSGLVPVIGGGFQIFSSGFPLSGGALNTPYQGGFPAGTMPLGLTPTIQAQGGALLAVSGTGTGYAYSGSFPRFNNGGMGFAGFQRTGQFARALLLSGGATGVNVTLGFLSMSMGGGGGFSWLPGSGLSGGVGGGGFVGAGAIGMPLV